MTGKPDEGKALEAELEDRLDELFATDDAPAAEPAQAMARPSDPLADLKSAVLSLDWEISEEELQNYLAQVEKAREAFGEDKIVQTLLQIMAQLGSYIRKHRGGAHPKTFKVMTAVFSSLETVASQPQLPEIEKRRILQQELKRYNRLRGLIKSRRSGGQAPAAGASAAAAPTVQDQAASPADIPVTRQMLAEAVQELKDYMRSEIEALRRDLKHG